jgi:hypothetical protein
MNFPMIDDDYDRLPGLYRASDLAMLLEEGRSYFIEDGGRTDDGQPLYMVFLGVTALHPGGADHGA